MNASLVLSVHRCWRLPVALLALWCAIVTCQAAPTAPQAGMQRLEVTDWLVPDTPLHTVDDVRRSDGWIPLKSRQHSLGRVSGQVWLRAEVSRTSCGVSDCLLELPYPHLRDITLFWMAGDTLIARQRGGYAQPATDPPCQGSCFVVPRHEGPMTLLVSVITDSPVLVPMHLYTPGAFQQHTRRSHLLLGMFYGTFFVMCLYHLFLYLSTRQPQYLLYVNYIASLGIWCASHDGNLRDYLLVRDSWYASYHFHFALTLWTLTAGALFSRSFLNLRSAVPMADRILQGLMACGLLGIVLIVMVGEIAIPALVSLLTLAFTIVTISAAVIELRQGRKMARYFLVAWLALAAGSLWWVLTLNGIVPYYDLSPFSVHAGGMIETVLLSLALGERINSLETERTRLRKIARHQLEEANRKLAASNRFKDEFLSNVTHELRTPMNGVLGSAELLRGTPLDSEQGEYLDTLMQSGTLMLRVIDDLLMFTQLSAGRYSPKRDMIMLATAFAPQIEDMRERCRRKGLRFDVRLGDALPLRAEGDLGKLQLVVQHLLDNAWKFTREGTISLDIDRADPPRNGDDRCWLHLTISDTGCGIDADYVNGVFEGFRQEDGGMSRRQGGLGIGLALCRQIVTRMSGRIELNSVKHKGTHVTVVVPLLPAAS